MIASAALLSALLVPAPCAPALAPAPQTGVARAAVASGSSSDERLTQVEQRLAELEQRNALLEERLGQVTRELEGSALAGFYTPVGDSRRGLAPGASRIYDSVNPLTIGGFGEALWNNVQGSGDDSVELTRAVVYLGYRFSDDWLLNTAFGLIDGGAGGDATDPGDPRPTGSVEADFAYLEYLGADTLSFRLGLLLMPMGFVNEQFEPPQIYSADRPLIEQRILPTRWSENGVGLVSESETVSYRAYLVNGFDARGFDADGLAGGRQGGSGALSEDLAVVGRLDWHGAEGVVLGGSAYYGNAGQGLAGAGSVQTTIVELHAELERGGFRGRALGVLAEVNDVAALNAAQMPAAGQSPGKGLRGYYLEAGYNVFEGHSEALELIPFVRYELLDTQSEVPLGFDRDPLNDLQSWTFGFAVKPLPGLILRADYVDFDSSGGTVADALRLSLGYVF